jgi:hypothetical protein
VTFGRVALCVFIAGSFLIGQASAQGDAQAWSSSSAAAATVPRLIRIQGSARDESGKPLSGLIGITFTLYKDANDQEGVWQETQNLQLDLAGHYSALLGVSNDAGLPQEVFSTGEARWLGVRPDGRAELPRILLLSVAYALKAADADTLGGKPASAFMLADSQYSSASGSSGTPAGSGSLESGAQILNWSPTTAALVQPSTTCTGITSDGTGTVNFLTKFTTACNIENSAIFESGGNVGIGNASPAGALDVSGSSYFRNALNVLGGIVMAPVQTATTGQGYASNPVDIEASAYNSDLKTPSSYLFRWQANPVGNNTANTGATLNLLYGVPGLVNQTGLSVASNGILTFASGQTFPGAGTGTVTSVATGAGLTGGPITGSGTISIPAGGVTNAMLANSSVTVQAGAGLAGGGTVPLGGMVTLTSSATGTVTNVSTGAGLTGGPITTAGTISIPSAGVTNAMLANPSITVKAGSGLSGGGTVALGGTVTLTNTASGGTVTSVATGAGLTGGPVTTTGTISIPSAGVTNAMLANPSITVKAGSGLSGGGTVALGGTVTLTNTSSGGTVTNVATGAGLTGGPVTTTGTISIPAAGVTNSMLANPSITVVPGSGLSGGGTVALGGSVTLSSSLSGTTDGIAYFSGATNLASTAAPTNGQILIGSTGKAPALATLTAGSNVSITNGPGSITISATGGGGGGSTLQFFATGSQRTGATQAATHNLNKVWGILLPYNVTTTEVIYDVTTADNTANDYDIGIFNDSGNLVVDIGPTPGTTFAPAKGFHTLSWTQGSTSLVAGRYYLGLTTNCASSCAALAAASAFVSFAINSSVGASTGGALSSTITTPADTWGSGIQPTVVVR